MARQKRITKKEIVKEIITCGKDPVYFLKTYAKIEHPKLGMIPFSLFDYQEDIIDKFLNERFNIILKARQLGVTTIVSGLLAWLLIFHKHQNVLILATKLEKSKITLRIVKNIIKYLPKWMQDSWVKIDVNNRTSMELENGSRISAIATSSDAGIGEAASFLFIDEAAHIENLDSLWAQIFPILSTGGRCCMSSTPRGAGSFFHKMWTNARDGKGNFNCRFGKYQNPEDPNEVFEDRLMWWVKPGCDKDWFEQETANDSPRIIAQERLCCFNASGDTFIWHEDIERLELQVCAPRKFFNANRDVWIWEDPTPGGIYLISCDVSRGDSADYSAFHVIRVDCQPIRQAAEYKGKIKSDQLGILLMAVSIFYNNAIIAPENNSGWASQAILKIQEAGYPYLHYTKKTRGKFKSYSRPDPYSAANRNDHFAGYMVTTANRPQMLAKMEQYVRLEDIVIHSSRVLEEFKTFVIINGRPEAQRGMHDDLVMALAGGIWLREEAFLFVHKTDAMTEAMFSSMVLSNTTTDQFKEFSYSNNVYDRARIQEHMEQENKIRMANGEEIDLSWLIKSG